MKKILILTSLLCLISILAVSAQTNQKKQILKLSKQIVIALKTKEMKKLSAFVHPSKGVRFSPYGQINKEKDLVFSSLELVNLLQSEKVLVWGIIDESEAEIKMTFAEYYTKFVYDYDFAKPDLIRYNLKKNNGIMINNIAEIYPKGIEVEYFIDGTEERLYASLRLVFEKQKRNWFLVGIVRDTPGI